MGKGDEWTEVTSGQRGRVDRGGDQIKGTGANIQTH